MGDCEEGSAGVAALVFILSILCIIPIVIIYSDGLEATNAKRNSLLLVVLVTVLGTIIGGGISCLLCTEPAKVKKIGGACTLIIVLGVVIPIGCIYGLTFTGIPNSCASLEECDSYCTSISEDYEPKLVDAKKIKLMILNEEEHYCGKCTCACDYHIDYDYHMDYHEQKCKPIEEAYFGLSTSTKIALGVLSGLALILICIGVILCFAGKKCRFVGGSIIISTVLLLACCFPILFIYGSETEAVKRDNLLIATLVPLFMTILGIIACYRTYALDFKCVIISVILYIVLAISIPVGIEFGTRFASTPHACALKDECPKNVAIQKGTIIALGIIGAPIALLIVVPLLLLTGLGIWECFKAIYKECRWCLFAGLYVVIIAGLLLACILPIITKYDSDETKVKRNNLLIATLVPLIMTIIGFSVVILGPCMVDSYKWDLGKKWWWITTLVTVYVVLAVSVPVGLEFGLRFESTPSVCGIEDPCPDNAGIQKGTIIALGVFGGLLSLVIVLPLMLLIGWAMWHVIKGIYSNCCPCVHRAPTWETDSRSRYNSGSDENTETLQRFTSIPTAPPLVPDAPPMEGNELSDYIDQQQPGQQQRYTVNMHESQFQEILADARREGDSVATTDRSHECRVCLDKESNMLMKPCKHLCMCSDCWIIYKRDNDCCPICRKKLKMSDIEEIFV